MHGKVIATWDTWADKDPTLVFPKTPPFLIFYLFFNNLLSPTYLSLIKSSLSLLTKVLWFPINFLPYYFTQRTWSHWYCGCPYHVRYLALWISPFEISNSGSRYELCDPHEKWIYEIHMLNLTCKVDLFGLFM